MTIKFQISYVNDDKAYLRAELEGDAGIHTRTRYARSKQEFTGAQCKRSAQRPA